MIIEHGIQPNCSELVIRLPGYTHKSIKDKLKKHNIVEAVIFDFYKYPKEYDWDDQVSRITPIDDLDEETQNLIKKYYDGNLTAAQIEDIATKLKTKDFIIHESTISLVEKGKEDEIKDYGAHIYISDSFEDDAEGKSYPAIMYHQHCQSDGFPLLKKMSEIFDSEVEPYDGGGIQDYENWLYGYSDQ